MMPRIRKAARVHGHRLLLRNATRADAAFIHDLRHQPERARYLSAIPPGVAHQQQWLQRYAADHGQAYFIICEGQGKHEGEALGTVRLYGARGMAFSWGSWVLRAGLPPYCGIESALVVYRYALSLGFDRAWFEVMAGNRSVWHFHERFGASRVREQAGKYHYELGPDALQAALHRYRRYLPRGIQIQGLDLDGEETWK